MQAPLDSPWAEDGIPLRTTPLRPGRGPGPQGTGFEPQLLARRDFPSGAELVCQFEVYGAARDETGMPRVAQGYRVLRGDGSVFKRLPESAINPTSLGALARVFILSLDDAPS